MQDFYNLHNGNMESSKEPQRWISLRKILGEDNSPSNNMVGSFRKASTDFIEGLRTDGYDGWLSDEDRYVEEVNLFEFFAQPNYDPLMIEITKQKLAEQLEKLNELKSEWSSLSGERVSTSEDRTRMIELMQARNELYSRS